MESNYFLIIHILVEINYEIKANQINKTSFKHLVEKHPATKNLSNLKTLKNISRISILGKPSL